MGQLIDEAAGATDPNKRKQLYTQVQKKALDEAILAFFADPINVFAYQKARLSDPVLDWSATYPQFYDASVTK
jgi:ABC-type transport system substrate-binding protein